MKMKKRLTALLLTSALLAMTPLSAMAALPAGGFVPTAAKIQYQEDGTWKDSGETMKWTFQKSGKMTGFSDTYVDSSGQHTYSEKFSWRGDFLKKVLFGDNSYFALSYKKKKLVSNTHMSSSGNKNTSTFKWNKRKATAQNSDGATGTLTINKKGKLTRTFSVYGSDTSEDIQTYYSNGNLKSMTTKFQYSGIATVGEYIFNKKGYLKSITWSDGDKNTFSYKTKKGKVRECTVASSLGSPYKIVYTNWKKVAHVRNTDGFGYMPFIIGWYSWYY